LPAGGGDAVGRRRQSLGEHHTGGERHRRRPGRQHTEQVDVRARLHHDQRHTERGHHAHGELDGTGAPAGDRPRQTGDEQRLQATERRGHATGQPVHPDDQQREEQGEVEQRERCQVAPLTPAGHPARPPRAESHEHEAGRQHPRRRDQQRAARRQQLGDRDVRGAPRDRGEDGEQCHPAHRRLHGQYLNVEILNVE
jgi:hypothetical protein